jgi:hypothetical protein
MMPLWLENAARALVALVLVAAFVALAVTIDRDASRTDCGIVAAQSVDVSSVSGCER